MSGGIAAFERELSQGRIKSGMVVAKGRSKRLGRQSAQRHKSEIRPAHAVSARARRPQAQLPSDWPGAGTERKGNYRHRGQRVQDPPADPTGRSAKDWGRPRSGSGHTVPTGGRWRSNGLRQGSASGALARNAIVVAVELVRVAAGAAIGKEEALRLGLAMVDRVAAGTPASVLRHRPKLARARRNQPHRRMERPPTVLAARDRASDGRSRLTYTSRRRTIVPATSAIRGISANYLQLCPRAE